jgi:hypothetical protein
MARGRQPYELRDIPGIFKGQRVLSFTKYRESHEIMGMWLYRESHSAAWVNEHQLKQADLRLKICSFDGFEIFLPLTASRI